MKSIVQHLRESRNLTQPELAGRSGLSLRTIQRIEAGNIPKGFTLKALAAALEIDPIKLVPAQEDPKIDRAKLINFSSLLGLLIPFGGIILPLILTYQTQDQKNKEFGKSIVSVQILIAVALSISQVASPFIQKGLSLHFPLFIFPLLFFYCLQVGFVIINGITLNKKRDLHKIFKMSIL